MRNDPRNTPARQTKRTLLGVTLAGILAMLIGLLIQNNNDDTPTAGVAANQERYSGPDWDAYEAGHAMSKPYMFKAEIPAGVVQTDNTGTLAGALRADKANAEWWCDHNMPDDLIADHPGERDALYGGCVDGLIPDAAGNPASYGID